LRRTGIEAEREMKGFRAVLDKRRREDDCIFNRGER
jgi:hypothetical protein